MPAATVQTLAQAGRPGAQAWGWGPRPGSPQRKRVDSARGLPWASLRLPPGPLLGSRRPPWPAMETQRASAHQSADGPETGVLRGPERRPRPDRGGREEGPSRGPGDRPGLKSRLSTCCCWALQTPVSVTRGGTTAVGGTKAWRVTHRGRRRRLRGVGVGGMLRGDGLGAGGRESQCWGGGRTQVAMAPSPGLVSVAGVGAACGVAAQEPRQPGPSGGAWVAM